MTEDKLKKIIIDDVGTRKDGSPNIAKFAMKWEISSRSVKNHLYGVSKPSAAFTALYKMIALINTMAMETLKETIIRDVGTRKDGSPNVAKFARKWELSRSSVKNHLYGASEPNAAFTALYRLIALINKFVPDELVREMMEDGDE